ncbi:MAG TPA: hypothetical protein VIJ63_24330, partial [Roseiarcus sp.]
GDNTFTPGLCDEFGIVGATGGVVGQFSSIAQAGDGLPGTLRLDAIYGSNAVALAVTPTFFSAQPSGTGSWSFNQASVGATLDLMRPAPGQTAANPTLQDLYNTLYGFDGPELGQAMTVRCNWENSNREPLSDALANVRHFASEVGLCCYREDRER